MLINAYDEYKRYFEDKKLIAAVIECEGEQFTLPSGHAHSSRQEFIEFLKGLNYDNGYGSQELFGVLWFKDESWAERKEYDGAEAWRLVVRPIPPKIVSVRNSTNVYVTEGDY